MQGRCGFTQRRTCHITQAMQHAIKAQRRKPHLHELGKVIISYICMNVSIAGKILKASGPCMAYEAPIHGLCIAWLGWR